MIPLIMKIRIPRASKPPVKLYLPIFIVWILLFAITLVFLPILLIASIVTWHTGQGKIMLLSYPMLFSVLWNMRGLIIDVEGEEETIYMSFI